MCDNLITPIEEQLSVNFLSEVIEKSRFLARDTKILKKE